MKITYPHPGIWCIRHDEPEAITPVSVRRRTPHTEGLAAMPGVGSSPVPESALSFRQTSRGLVLTLEIDRSENIYGFGLQLKSMLASGKKRQVRVNADPRVNTGDSHAPAPVFFSSAGYGVYVDTARYASFYVHTHAEPFTEEWRVRVNSKGGRGGQSVEALYASERCGHRVVVDIPVAQGVDVYILAGPTLLDAVRRYNLFSGGGCLPPVWALGNWYRAFVETTADGVRGLMDEFETHEMPFSVLGLEPGWQTARYPNTFAWDREAFPDPEGLTRELLDRGLRLNLWENAFVDPDAPFAEALRGHCASETSTDGLAPDFLDPQGREAFQGWHDSEFVAKGVSGFKLDECDNSDFSPMAWSFPEWAEFPSGADGEQMHSLYGVLYQDVIEEMYRRRGEKTFGLVRSSGAMAAPYPFALYSDLYDHREFIRGVVTAGFCGMLWTPELRHAKSEEDLLRRVQSAVLSPCALLNPWYIPLPPWVQIDYDKNHAGERMEDVDGLRARIKTWLDLRASLVPYLYTAFHRYAVEGVPPFRALVMDHPEDPETALIDDQWMIGPDVLFAPLVAGEAERELYLPEGMWCDYHTGEHLEGGKRHIRSCSLDEVLLFVKEGCVIPAASGNPAAGGELVLEPRVYGQTQGVDGVWEGEDGPVNYALEVDEGHVRLVAEEDSPVQLGQARFL
jgi:alpha-D-xyloside xylohydrolase